MSKIEQLAICILITLIFSAASFYNLGLKDAQPSDKKKMEQMMGSITGTKGTVVQESAMVWRAYVLDYSASGPTAQEATYLLLKKYEMGETDSLTIID